MSALLLLLALVLPAAAQPGIKPNPKPVWSVSGFDQPDSAHYDPQSAAIYVSNAAGWISKLSPDGKVLKKQWAAGLEGPRALRTCGGRLFVADVSRLVEISLSTGGIRARTPVRDAKLLNGLAVDAACAVYLSDTFTSRIYKVDGKKEVSIVAEGPTLMSPNGLCLDGKSLVAAGWGLTADWTTKAPGRLLRVDLATKKVSTVPGPMGNLDGLQRVKDRWLVSDWASGTVLRVAPNGQTEVLLHGLQGPADLGQAPGLLLVPRAREGLVEAYRL